MSFKMGIDQKNSLNTYIIGVSIFLLIASFFVDSHACKGGISQKLELAIFLVTVVVSFMYLSTMPIDLIVERAFYAVLIAVLALFLAHFILEWILIKIYGLEFETKVSSTKANLIFYFVTHFIVVLLVIWIKRLKIKYNRY
jgi:hypothetical protein